MARASKRRRFTGKGVEGAPTSPGVYRLWERRGISYVGSGKDMQERLERHLGSQRFQNITSFDFRRSRTAREARAAEKSQIKRHNPPQNHT